MTLLATTSPVVWYTTRASGIVCLLLFTGATALGLLTTARAGSDGLPRFAVSELHRRISLLAVVFLGIHVLTAVLDSFVHISVLAIAVPFFPGYSPLWIGVGAIALDLMAAVIITSLFRQAIPANVWRGVHWLAYLAWPLAMAHSVGVGSDIRFGWVDIVVAICSIAVLAALGWRIWDRPHPQGARTAVPREAPAPAFDRPTASGSRFVTSSSRPTRR